MSDAQNRKDEAARNARVAEHLESHRTGNWSHRTAQAGQGEVRGDLPDLNPPRPPRVSGVSDLSASSGLRGIQP